MNLCYPVTLKTYKNGTVGATFPDVPEAITCGKTADEAVGMAADALVVALSSYLDDRRQIPSPSKRQRGQTVLWLPPRVALKAAIHNAMISRGMLQSELAEKLGIDARQVRRLIDFDHESRLSQLDAALEALGLRATIGIVKVQTPSTKAA
ncbi:MAG: type II toxin-antitoxin system HicB family antitoxin [Candidatus Riflebacteria bacterium]|nr:type II toxin-antitoxin system HicB family antitoxin [Candidatus Riflebacteria bacterium]